MYQRFAMAFKILRPQSEDEAHDEAQHLVGDQEEDARENHHHEHHGGRDHGLLARGPGDLRALGAHLLDEFARIGLRHVAFRSLSRPCLVCRPARRAPSGLVLVEGVPPELAVARSGSASRHRSNHSWDAAAYNASFRACRCALRAGLAGALAEAPLRHSRVSTTSPTPDRPMTSAALCEMSMTRPPPNGPRSLTRTTTERPVRSFVTLRRVPKGRLRCAAVSALRSNVSPFAVRRP